MLRQPCESLPVNTDAPARAETISVVNTLFHLALFRNTVERDADICLQLIVLAKYGQTSASIGRVLLK